LGLLVALGHTVSLRPGLLLVALIALPHGYAHVAEMHSAAAPLVYGAGFLLSTSVLHLAGVLAGMALLRADFRRSTQGRMPALRLSGAAVTAMGMATILGFV
jgi:urease accessory protein